MKHIDKKLSDDFSKFLNQKMFYKNNKPLKQTKNKLEFFNKCTAVVEEFINTYIASDLSLNKQSEPTSSPIVPKNANVMSIKIKNPIAAGHGCTVMTPAESMKADDQKYFKNKKKNDNSNSAIYCEHANEMPTICKCPTDCYCNIHGNCGKRE
jgi:hypothetical protein